MVEAIMKEKKNLVPTRDYYRMEQVDDDCCEGSFAPLPVKSFKARESIMGPAATSDEVKEGAGMLQNQEDGQGAAAQSQLTSRLSTESELHSMNGLHYYSEP